MTQPRQTTVRGRLTVVRPATDDDVDLLVRWHADPEASRYWDDETFTLEQRRERLERQPVDAWIVDADRRAPVAVGAHALRSLVRLRNVAPFQRLLGRIGDRRAVFLVGAVVLRWVAAGAQVGLFHDSLLSCGGAHVIASLPFNA